MRYAFFMLVVPMGIAGGIFLSAIGASAETIYHWKDQGGVSCFSNTNVPGGASDLSVMFTAEPAAITPEQPGLEIVPEENTGDVSDVESGSDRADPKVAILLGRIERRSISIEAIENRLRQQPDDFILRDRLNRKKQYLHEDLIHLGLLYK